MDVPADLFQSRNKIKFDFIFYFNMKIFMKKLDNLHSRSKFFSDNLISLAFSDFLCLYQIFIYLTRASRNLQTSWLLKRLMTSSRPLWKWGCPPRQRPAAPHAGALARQVSIYQNSSFLRTIQLENPLKPPSQENCWDICDKRKSASQVMSDGPWTL